MSHMKFRAGCPTKEEISVIAIENEDSFSALQQFLACVHLLTSLRRLLRFLYVMEKSG